MNLGFAALALGLCLGAATTFAAEKEEKEEKPIPLAEAAKKVDHYCTVEMKVKSSKNALHSRQEIYLDSEEDFRHEKNFAVVLTAAAAELLAEKGIKDPAEHFRGKTIRATGKVGLDEHEKPRIVIDHPKWIKIVEPKAVRQEAAIPSKAK